MVGRAEYTRISMYQNVPSRLGSWRVNPSKIVKLTTSAFRIITSLLTYKIVLAFVNLFNSRNVLGLGFGRSWSGRRGGEGEEAMADVDDEGIVAVVVVIVDGPLIEGETGPGFAPGNAQWV
jgi:hypothetical protein